MNERSISTIKKANLHKQNNNDKGIHFEIFLTLSISLLSCIILEKQLKELNAGII